METGAIEFGTKTRTGILLTLALIEESYPRQLALILKTSVSNVIKALDSLEQAGMVAGRMMGRTRLISFNPQYKAVNELRVYLDKLALSSPELLDAIGEIRKRPRRAGKKL